MHKIKVNIIRDEIQSKELNNDYVNIKLNINNKLYIE